MMFCVKKVSLNTVHRSLFNFISHRCGRCNTVNCNYAKHHSFNHYHFKQQFFINHLIIVHITGKVFPKVQHLDGGRNTAGGVFPIVPFRVLQAVHENPRSAAFSHGDIILR